MGFLDTVRDVVSTDEEGGGSDVDVGDIDDVIDGETEVEGTGDELPSNDESEEEEKMEWDSAYDFAEWWLEDEGFADLVEFGEKAMMQRMENSPMFRDRIASGLDTLNSINEAKTTLDEIAGSDTKERDIEDMAERLRAANEVISATKSLNGQDEMMMRQGMELARDAVEAIGGSVNIGSSNVDARMEQSEERI